MSMQSLKKIGENLFKIESGNAALTDGRTVGQTDRHKKNQNFRVAGFKNRIVMKRKERIIENKQTLTI